MTSPDAFTGRNFRRGGFLKREGRYARAEEFLATVRELGDSWQPGTLVGDKENGVFARDPGHFVHNGQQSASAASSPCRAPRRDSRSSPRPATPTRAASSPRRPPTSSSVGTAPSKTARRSSTTSSATWPRTAATFVLGDTDAEAHEHAREIRLQQVRPATAIQFLEQVWSRDLSDYDVDGPLPEIDPDPDAEALTWGRVRHEKDQVALARKWRAIAEEKKLSIRELVIEMTARQQFVGTPSTVAATIDDYVQSDAADGFVLVPHLTPTGLDEFVEKVVPLLQERGVFRTEYTGTTLREQLFQAVSAKASPRAAASPA